MFYLGGVLAPSATVQGMYWGAPTVSVCGSCWVVCAGPGAGYGAGLLGVPGAPLWWSGLAVGTSARGCVLRRGCRLGAAG